MPRLFYLPLAEPGVLLSLKAFNEMTPDRIGQGSFQFLGFDHWVTSLSAGSTGLLGLVGIPSVSIHVLQLAFAIGIYVKRKMLKAQPAGVLTIFGITFFRTIRIPFFKGFCKTGYPTNNFPKNGIKRRKRLFSVLKC